MRPVATADSFLSTGSGSTCPRLLDQAHKLDPEPWQTLGCQCGEWGCWPLETRLRLADGVVTWDSFRQPHRPKRDYSGFGPFRFDEQQYRDAVFDVFAALASDRQRRKRDGGPEPQ